MRRGDLRVRDGSGVRKIYIGKYPDEHGEDQLVAYCTSIFP